MQTITAIKRTPRVSKSTGKPFVSLGLQTQEYGVKWLSGFDSDRTEDWKVGDEVDIIVEQKGEYLNFSLPKISKVPASNAEVMHTLQQIMTTLGAMKQKIDEIYNAGEYDKRLSDGTPMPKF